MAVEDGNQNVTKSYRGDKVDSRVMEGTWDWSWQRHIASGLRDRSLGQV